MKKRNKFLLLICSIFLIGFVSAYGSYNAFSISNFLDEIGGDTIVLGAVFIISFAILNYALSRVFRDNKATSGIVSLAISLLIVYGINKAGYDFGNLFYNIGLPEGIVSGIFPVLLIIGAALIVWKLSFGALFLISGILLLFITVFTELIYENGIATIIGIFCTLIGIWLIKRKDRDGISYPGSERYNQWRDYRSQRRQQKYDWRTQKYRDRLNYRQQQKELKRLGKLNKTPTKKITQSGLQMERNTQPSFWERRRIKKQQQKSEELEKQERKRLEKEREALKIKLEEEKRKKAQKEYEKRIGRKKKW